MKLSICINYTSDTTVLPSLNVRSKRYELILKKFNENGTQFNSETMKSVPHIYFNINFFNLD